MRKQWIPGSPPPPTQSSHTHGEPGDEASHEGVKSTLQSREREVAQRVYKVVSRIFVTALNFNLTVQLNLGATSLLSCIDEYNNG